MRDLLDHTSGTGWWYSNSNYALLGAVTEKVSGKTWAAFMKAEIFDKLGMVDAAADDARARVRAGTPPEARAATLEASVPGGARQNRGPNLLWQYIVARCRAPAEVYVWRSLFLR